MVKSFGQKCTKTIANYSEKAALSCVEVDFGVPPQQPPPVVVVLVSVSVFTSISSCSSAVVSIRFLDAFESMFSFPMRKLNQMYIFNFYLIIRLLWMILILLILVSNQPPLPSKVLRPCSEFKEIFICGGHTLMMLIWSRSC